MRMTYKKWPYFHLTLGDVPGKHPENEVSVASPLPVPTVRREKNSRENFSDAVWEVIRKGHRFLILDWVGGRGTRAESDPSGGLPPDTLKTKPVFAVRKRLAGSVEMEGFGAQATHAG